MALAQYSMNWASGMCGAATNFFHSNNFPSKKTVINNVKVWDGEQLTDYTSVTIQDQTVQALNTIKPSNIPGRATVVDGNGGFLMPGLIDAHIHVATGIIPILFQHNSHVNLKSLVDAGVTTAFDMGTFPSSNMQRFHKKPEKGLPSVLFSGAAACVKGGFPAMLKGFPDDAIVTSEENATNFANTRISEGADYLKIFINGDGLPDPKFQKIIKDIGDQNDKFIVTHAPDFQAHDIARSVGGKFITHVPKDRALNETGVMEMKTNNQVAIPTLIMSQNLINIGRHFFHKDWDYKSSKDSVTLMYNKSVPILVGTDASKPIGFVGYGDTMHTEMSLLYDAGLTNEDILRGATSLPAYYFGLSDRGKIATGMRADLLLLKANPLENINNSRTIDTVWTAGAVAFKGSSSSALD